jgi:predicted DNA-binding antitoxin AbrB/MazE fold protein
MAKSINALFENGVFKPLEKVRLKERQEVKLTVIETNKPARRIGKRVVKRRQASGRFDIATHPSHRIVGLFKSGVCDLAENHDRYLYR